MTRAKQIETGYPSVETRERRKEVVMHATEVETQYAECVEDHEMRFGKKRERAKGEGEENSKRKLVSKRKTD